MALTRTYAVDYADGADKIGVDSTSTGGVKKIDADLTLAYTHLTNLQKNYTAATRASGSVVGMINHDTVSDKWLGKDNNGNWVGVGGLLGDIAMFFATSQSYTIPYSGKYRLSALGAGASGAAIFTTTSGGAATGGGGGAFAEIEVYLIAGDVITIVIGAGGAAVASSVSGTGYDGTDGGETTIHGSGSTIATALNMHAGGGKAGLKTVTNAEAKAGGAGGTATGGTINATGGAGGAATHLTNGAEAGGGGASGSPFGTGGAGGSAISAGAAIIAAGGGGAVNGFRGGNATTAVKCGGGGTGGNGGDDAVTAGVNRLGMVIVCSSDGIVRTSQSVATLVLVGFDSLIDPFRGLTGGGSAGNQTVSLTAVVGPGAGGGSPNAAGNTFFQNSVCGGTGGCSLAAASGSLKVYLGGGTGGATSTATGPATSGTGGNGLCAIERIG